MGPNHKEDHVPNQHLVSQVVLRRWTEDGRLLALNVRYPKAQAMLRTPAQVGYQKDYIREYAGAWERRWSTIETAIPDALDAVDRGELLDAPQLIAVVKDVLALHWARSAVTAGTWQRSLSSESTRQRIANLAEILRQPGAVEELFEHFSGGLVSPGTPGATAWTMERVQEHWDRQLGEGGEAFAEQVGAHFDRFREWLDPKGLEIGTAPEGAEFVISDAPVQPLDHSTRRVGVLSGVSLDRADTVLMPLTPKAVAAVAKHGDVLDLPRPAVASVNAALIMSAHERVFFRPSSGLEDWARKVSAARCL